MKYSFNVGNVEADGCTIKDISVEFEVSSEEMLTQMSNLKSICSGAIDLYKIIKGEVASGEVACLVRGIQDIVFNATVDEAQ